MALELKVEGLSASYGAVRALENVSINVKEGETVALLGTNGNGKSTLMKCLTGLVVPRTGSITLEIDGTVHNLIGKGPQDIVDLGVAMVAEGRRLFPRLTVEENLYLGAYRPAARAAIAKNLEFCFETFPVLKERRRQLAVGAHGEGAGQLGIAPNHDVDGVTGADDVVVVGAAGAGGRRGSVGCRAACQQQSQRRQRSNSQAAETPRQTVHARLLVSFMIRRVGRPAPWLGVRNGQACTQPAASVLTPSA